MEKVKVLCSCEGESLNDLFQEWSYQNETGKKVLDTELLGREGIELRRASVSEAFELINAGNNYGLLIIDCGTQLELVENFRLRNPNSLVAYSEILNKLKWSSTVNYQQSIIISCIY